MTVKDHFKNQILPFFNIKDYWDNGYKGQGIVVASVEGTDSKHGYDVMNTVLTYAPECTFISYNDCHKDTSATGGDSTHSNFDEFADWCIENKVDIVTSSLDWLCDTQEALDGIQKLYNAGIIFCNAGSNDGIEVKHSDQPRKTYNIDKEVISVGGIMFDIKEKITWSGFNYGEAIDVCGIAKNCPTIDKKLGTYYSWTGTSVATPMVVGMLATYKSYDNTLNNKNIWDMIDNLDVTCDYKGFTHKVFILPKYVEKEIKAMEDKDEKFTSEWAKESRKHLMELGITDGLRPKDLLTREELWTMLDRFMKLYE